LSDLLALGTRYLDAIREVAVQDLRVGDIVWTTLDGGGWTATRRGRTHAGGGFA